MEKKLFAELVTSLKEAAAISKGKARPSRQFRVEAPDVKGVRRRLGMSQQRFARSFGLSVGTVRDWEQGRSLPDRPARVLLRLIERDPERVLQTLQAAD